MVIGRYKFKETILHFYSANYFFKRIFPRDVFYFSLTCTKFLLELIFVSSIFILAKFLALPFFTLIILFSSFLLFEFIIRIITEILPTHIIIYAYPIVNFYLTSLHYLFLPFVQLKSYLHMKIKKTSYDTMLEKKKILEMINESTLNHFFDTNNQKILASLITFKEKVAREIMIPRVDIFALNTTDTLKSVQKLFLAENYSRIPVYKKNLDNIIGILMYKDVLNLVLKKDQDILDMPIENFVKPVLYAPENKKIPQLFQELKSKQIHMAIIVNEYGGTEGIVTIEDILEELVGEIDDEYDTEEELQFKKNADGSYILDAKMSILDIEEKIGIKIPSNPEYETIGGYVFYMAGTIPLKGWALHHDEFEMEVVESKDRVIEKIRIKPC